MEYKITYYDDLSNKVGEHRCNWLSEVNLIVANGLENGYDIIVKKIEVGNGSFTKEQEEQLYRD